MHEKSLIPNHLSPFRRTVKLSNAHDPPRELSSDPNEGDTRIRAILSAQCYLSRRAPVCGDGTKLRVSPI